MKNLTLSRVARANIRVNRKAYVSLFVGILLAVFLATATSLCAWGTVRGHEEQMAQRVGWMDMFELGNYGPTDDQLRNCGFFQRLGHVTVDATVKDSKICTGYYDEEAEKLMNRVLIEGRMPEKTGEIAAEQSALVRLGVDKASVGDTLKLTMTPIHGEDEEKSFILVGILNEQTTYLEMRLDEEGMRFPAMLVSPEETYKVGSKVVHRVLTYAPLITFNQVVRNCPLAPELNVYTYTYGVSRETGEAVYDDSGYARARNLISRIALWVVLGAALMLSACVGITTAMESLLSRKNEDIGMLRAIGATRRQVRRIYGAEAWMLTATALPAGLLLGIIVTWIISMLAPDQVVFSLNLWLLIPILFISGLCVFVASRLPLYHASAQMPMGVLRDTALLRRAGKVRNHMEFKTDRLIAGRRVRLHPLRQAGTAGMIALTLLSTLLLGEVVLGIRQQNTDTPAFEMNGPYDSAWVSDPFFQPSSDAEEIRYEMRKIASYEGVTKVQSVTYLNANLLMHEVPDYFKTRKIDAVGSDGEHIIHSVGTMHGLGSGNDWLFMNDEELADARARSNEDWGAQEAVQNVERMDLIRSQIGIADTIVPITVQVLDCDPTAFREYVTDGSINPEKLDSGEQVLVYAPNLCARKTENGGLAMETFSRMDEINDREWDTIIQNDYFKQGLQLSLLELSGRKADEVPMTYDIGSEWKDWYQSMDCVRAETKVGAVLGSDAHIDGIYLSGITVILTDRGAQALGLKLPNPSYAEIFCSRKLTEDQEAFIDNQLNQIATRGFMMVDNQLQAARTKQARKIREIAILTGMILLFFAVSVFMQVTGVSRQIRSDTRMIGTLRAVGADLRTLVGCYRLPVWVCAGAALIPCLLFYAITEVRTFRLFTHNHPVIMIPVLIVLAACVALACTAGIRSRLIKVARQPIVENIREL